MLHRKLEPRNNCWLSDSGKYFGDIFSYTFGDDTYNIRTPRLFSNYDNTLNESQNWVPPVPCFSDIQQSRTGSLPDLTRPYSIPTTSASFSSAYPIDNTGLFTRYVSSEASKSATATETLKTSPPDRAISSNPSSGVPRDRPNNAHSRHRCPQKECPFAVGRKSEVERHYRNAHCGRYSYTCDVYGCENNKGRGYSRIDKLREHQWKRHANLGFRKGSATSLIGDVSGD